jgi:hypothetical protein
VYVIEKGRVTEQGTPAELARGDGWFARFIRSAADVHEGAAEELIRGERG